MYLQNIFCIYLKTEWTECDVIPISLLSILLSVRSVILSIPTQSLNSSQYRSDQTFHCIKHWCNMYRNFLHLLWYVYTKTMCMFKPYNFRYSQKCTFIKNLHTLIQDIFNDIGHFWRITYFLYQTNTLYTQIL